MEQEKLESRVRRVFEEQGFDVEKDGNRFSMSNNEELDASAFSSGSFEPGEVVESVNDEDIVFVDEGLEGLKDKLEKEVSVIRQREEKKYDLPSYEIVGDIALINELGEREKEEVVEGIRYHNPHVETILVKVEPLQGEFRVGEYEPIFGSRTETLHTEHGSRFRVDPTEVYFSERLAAERERIVSRVEEGERVLVMFAGVGPYAILAAKQNPEKVVAIEKNPAAAEYMKENVELNSLEGRVEAIQGDVAEVLPGLGEFDRIVMPLPESANEFLELAFEHAAEDAVIHYYRFVEDEDWESIEDEVEDAASNTGREYEILGEEVAGHRGAYLARGCVDIRVK